MIIGRRKAFTLIEVLLAISILAATVPSIIHMFFSYLKMPSIDQGAMALIADMDNCMTNVKEIENKEIQVDCILMRGKSFSVSKKTEKTVALPNGHNLYLNRFTITKHPAADSIEFVAYAADGIDLALHLP